MSSDNRIILNMIVKIFGETQKMLWPFWCYLTALLMTKDVIYILIPEFKKELPGSQYFRTQNPNKEKEGKLQNEHNAYGVQYNDINCPEMIN